MARPQSNDLRRNGMNPALEPEAAATAKGNRVGPGGGDHSVVPEDNRPGHHPDVEQDKPDPDAFIARARAVAQRAEDHDDDTGPDRAKAPVTAIWAADPEAAAASPLLIVRSGTDTARRLVAGILHGVSHTLDRLGDVLDPD